MKEKMTDSFSVEVGESIFGDVPCRGGVALLVGKIIKVTDKAIQIHYEVEPIFVGVRTTTTTVFRRCAWVPKSQIERSDNVSGLQIKKWFVGKMKSISIKPYTD